MSGAMSIRSIRDLLEAGIGMVKVARRKDVEAQAHLNAEARVIDALVGANASETTRETFRKKLRAGELDDKEIEIQVADTGGAAELRHSRHARRLGQRDQSFRHAGQGVWRAHQDAAHDGEGEPRNPDRRGKRQASRPGADRRRKRSTRSRTTASSSSTRSTRSARARNARAPT